MVSAGAPRSSSSLSSPRTLGVRSGTTTATYANNSRNELSQDSRKKIINKIMDTLQRYTPFTGPDGMNELKNIALRYEDEIYASAVDQQDYLRKISLKMLSLGSHVSRNANSLAGGSSSNPKPMDPGLLMQTQMRNASHSPTTVGSNGIPLPDQPQTQEASLLNRLTESRNHVSRDANSLPVGVTKSQDMNLAISLLTLK